MRAHPPAGRSGSEVQTVAAWHEALNYGDVERLVTLSHPNVEVGGPRGSGHGAQILREWVDRANVRLEPGRMFCEANAVIVEQEAEWQSTEPDDRQTVASVFLVHEGLVTSVVRYPDLASALRAAKFDETPERRSG
jgi:ketosteroid isomerase-like protein